MSDFRDLFHEAVDHVEPRPALDDIRTRVSEEATMSVLGNRRWIAPLAAAAAVAAIAGGFLALQGEDPSSSPVTPPPTSPSSPAPSPTAPSPSPPSATNSRAVPVYYLGDTAEDAWLYREFHKASCDGPDICLAEEAVEEALTGTPEDADYRSPWPAGTTVNAVLTDGNDLITVDLGPLTLHDRPAGVSQREAELAIEQVVYTAQGAYGKGRLPVQLLLDGARSDTVLGVPTSEPLANGPLLDTLAHVNFTAPAEGERIAGDSLMFNGVANSFEANVVVRLLDQAGTVVIGPEPVTADGWMGEKLFPFQGVLMLQDVAPGTYLLEASTDDPSGGAEGSGPHRDTKTVIVGD